MRSIERDRSRAGKRSAISDGHDKDYIATRAAYKLNLHGPAYRYRPPAPARWLPCIWPVKAARRRIRYGGCRRRGALFPPEAGYRYQPGMIFSPDGHCRPLTPRLRAPGPVTVSAAWCCVPERRAAVRRSDYLGDPLQRVNNDGNRKVGYTAPSVAGQQQSSKRR